MGPTSTGSPKQLATSGSAGPGNILAADTAQIDGGARHLDRIADIVADISKKLQVVSIHAEGHGPISAAIRANYTPAATGSVQFVADLATLLSIHSAQTASLSRMLHSVDMAATDAAKGVGRRH
jgi:hypothetical protein